MDDIDRAAEAEEWYRSQALEAAALHERMTPTGFCYNCDEVLFMGCFCDADCRDDFQLREKQQKQKV